MASVNHAYCRGTQLSVSQENMFLEILKHVRRMQRGFTTFEKLEGLGSGAEKENRGPIPGCFVSSEVRTTLMFNVQLLSTLA
jgi:hypothetical protein